MTVALALPLICTYIHIYTGGPTREFLHLPVSEISRNNSLFCGPTSSRVSNHNMLELSRKIYQYVGAILVFSIVYGGPAPGFFAESVTDYVAFGFDKVKALIADILDPMVKGKVEKVKGVMCCIE